MPTRLNKNEFNIHILLGFLHDNEFVNVFLLMLINHTGLDFSLKLNTLFFLLTGVYWAGCHGNSQCSCEKEDHGLYAGVTISNLRKVIDLHLSYHSKSTDRL